MDKKMVNNIMCVREMKGDKSLRNKGKLAEKLYYLLQENKNESLNNILYFYDNEKNLKRGTGLVIFRCLIVGR
ncbi:TnsA endonuclease C-terminal domain-containing protein [Clostridium paraputrificum]|uniref:TnsA endonuclease C-terminal domain-containing protein n=1 Tax=Clostridium paraputrificum TaxID=29363 RepID=UPI00232BB389|nr:TnsA endonuclease C-terminal domain-containing protein [Clostridium paraputrificum]MDB2105596.1 TnsA endonuclease C-terminal domain-containing protein [Clostridium paraputrificum]MDB2112163.1 TnsA endonuclease C-terminal domain-containing protein [Clostridium paraputrificum]